MSVVINRVAPRAKPHWKCHSSDLSATVGYGCPFAPKPKTTDFNFGQGVSTSIGGKECQLPWNRWVSLNGVSTEKSKFQISWFPSCLIHHIETTLQTAWRWTSDRTQSSCFFWAWKRCIWVFGHRGWGVVLKNDMVVTLCSHQKTHPVVWLSKKSRLVPDLNPCKLLLSTISRTPTRTEAKQCWVPTQAPFISLLYLLDDE